MDIIEYKREMHKVADAAVTSVERIVNGGGKEARDEVVSRLSSLHRTLQQRMVGDILIPIVRNFAKMVESNNYDPRNELACKACAAMIKGLAEEFPYLANGEGSLPLV